MLRKLLGKDSNALSSTEECAVTRLATKHQRLLRDGGRVVTKSEAGQGACAAFLADLNSVACVMHLDPAPRAYRAGFTINYRALFPDEARNYRVDVLEASVEQNSVIWVNGDKFEFSAETMRRAQVLQGAWFELGCLLERWRQAAEQPRNVACPRPVRMEMRDALSELDCAWANFEHKYIAELIDIEEKARRLIVQAIEHERCLQLLEAHHGDGDALQQVPDYREEQTRLVACVAHLNSVANCRRKGRDDLGVDVLSDATAVLRRFDAEEYGAMNAAQMLATDVVESFQALREYLREVEQCLERVDPHLCNNAGLVARLVDWEESWEVGVRYVQHEGQLEAVSDLVAEIQAAQRIAPALVSMCDECDVELFLVLPRIMWLRFLANPTQYTELIQSLLPHHFVSDELSQPATYMWDAELEAFCERFRAARGMLVDAQPAGVAGVLPGDVAGRVAWDLLVKRVVGGVNGKEDVYACLAPGLRDAVMVIVEDLLHELERWSIELQRHCPQDWNQCIAILMQCLTGGGKKQAQGRRTFKV